MKHTTFLKTIGLFALGFLLLSCKELPPGEYDASEIGKIKQVIPGIIISKRQVNLHKASPDVPLSNKTGPDSLINTGYNETHGVEYVIKLNSGGIISVVQAEDLKLKNKQKILVIYGKKTRVVADNGSDAY